MYCYSNCQNISPVVETKGSSLCSQKLIVGTCRAS